MKAVIFDMDGLIIDSEPLWRKAECSVFRNRGLDFTEDMCRKTMGMRIDEVVMYWQKIYQWEASENKSIEDAIVNTLIEHIKTEGKALTGVIDTIQLLHQKNIPLAIASSSNMRIINTVVDVLNIRPYFKVIHSAEFETYGKPHPQVFISTAEQLDLSPSDCLVFEDSKHGMIAALAASMNVIIIPESPDQKQNWFELANEQLNSMTEFKLETYFN